MSKKISKSEAQVAKILDAVVNRGALIVMSSDAMGKRSCGVIRASNEAVDWQPWQVSALMPMAQLVKVPALCKPGWSVYSVKCAK